MGFDIYIDNHDIEVNQTNKNQLHVSEKILCVNPKNESYSANITVWVQQNSEIIRFGPVVNDSYMGGNHSQSDISLLIFQYNLSDNGIEIPGNSSLQIILEYNIEFSSDEFNFEKTFYYSNYFLVVSIFPFEDTEIEPSGIELDYNAKDNYYLSHDRSTNSLGDHFAIYFHPKEESSDASTLLFFVLIVIIVVVLIVFQMNRENSEKNRALADKARKSNTKMKNVRMGVKSGKKEKSKQETQNKKKTGKNRESLLETKKSLLLALKRLDEDNAAGLLSDDVYKDLRQEYKKKAIKVMKKIDEHE